ncbi:BglG family transcription antiterminator [Sediminivirga luteola]|uniref:Transcriptional antiterminator n=1 Tax=Sediminivirga luteola TaxID=1774748 RepID=A0A8J2TXG8_9MICO|nr:PTS sugar transporter subunit IIA [Sediminivirga luteola]MCI2266275.1 PRD domain-containing protein [Sediminivirga luteola]GGA12268.1 transcriptional antiterminator [Sediminivirga luteola]
MSKRRQERLIGILLRDEGWITAAALADVLGVTPRSVRSYIAQINARAAGGDAIESGPAGYRANRAVLAGLRADPVATPRDRLHGLVRELLRARDGIDVYETADRLGVSDATVEADLSRVRSLLAGAELRLERSGSRARLAGDELAQRRLVSRLAHEEMEQGAFDLEVLRKAVGSGTVPEEALGPFKRDLVAELGELGYYVNEFASADAVLHVAIAADRVAQGRALERTHGEPAPEQQRLAETIDRLAQRHLRVALGQGDLRHLASLVLTRVIAPGQAQGSQVPLDREVQAAVAAAVSRAARGYAVDLDQADFVQRLALHVQNLVHRAREHGFSRNPLTRSLKSAYPMIFEVAVSISSDIGERLGISIHDDEIAYIAMHVGGRLERSRRAESVLTATIVCPGYYELHELLRSRIDRSLGASIEVTGVETRVDVDWKSIGTDLVLTTIDPPAPDERTVRVPPFLTDADVERITAAASRLRRGRRLARLRAELERYLDGRAFIRPLPALDEEGIIRLLGASLVEQGVIGEEYIENTIERERLSSTAFTEALAVPHALRMTASRTAIAIGIADGSIPWGESRVQVVALAAFSAEERDAFQTVFEQFVEVFSERDSVQRIVRRGTDFPSFLDELAAVIDG